MRVLTERREQTQQRIDRLQHELKEVESLLNGNACVYATGSFGRHEAGETSDLDLFMVERVLREQDDPGSMKKLVNNLDETIIKADLIRATRALQIPDFDGDGKYLSYYTVEDLIKTLGKRDDDQKNTFTARLLLLLESHCLIGSEQYNDVIRAVIKAYWRDYETHVDNFVPAFLLNDILRLWRTFCVNYEAGRSGEDLAKHKVKNYKLKYSRLLTCYSAILYMLAVYKENRTVSPDDAFAMSALSPTARLEQRLKKEIKSVREKIVEQETEAEVKQLLNHLLEKYCEFLEITSAGNDALQSKLADRDQAETQFNKAKTFGDIMAQAVQKMSDQSGLFRWVLV